jgi:hypothetical protein
MTASFDSVLSILVEWQNRSQQLELKIWGYGISAMQGGAVVRCDHEAFVIADSRSKFQANADAIKRVILAQSAAESTVKASLLELELSGGLSVTIYEV